MVQLLLKKCDLIACIESDRLDFAEEQLPTMSVCKTAVRIAALSLLALNANPEKAKVSKASYSHTSIDRDLLEVGIPQLETFYRRHKYTVTKVVNWYIQRIKRYNGVYGAIETLDEKEALAT